MPIYTYSLHNIRLQCISHLSFAPIPLSLRSGRSFWAWGQSSRVSPVLDFLLVDLSCSLSPLRPSRSALLFSHTLPLTFSATLWCNVSASSFTFTLSLSLSRPFRHSNGDSAWKETTKEKTHTHKGHSLPLLPLSHTHTSMWNKVIVKSRETFPAPSRGLLFLSHTGCWCDTCFSESWRFRTLELILEPAQKCYNQYNNPIMNPMTLESTLKPQNQS